jgi:EpsI family protein
MIDLFRRSGWHAALLLVFTPLLAFGTNALRSVGLVLNPASNIASIHSLQGIGMLLASVLVLYGFDGLLERLGVPGAKPLRVSRERVPRPPARARLACAFAFVALLGVVSAVVTPWRVASPEVPLAVDAIPRRLDGWRSVDLETDRLFLGMAAFTGPIDRRYAKDGAWVDVFVASGSPRMRLRSFYSPKTAIPGSGWIVEERRQIEASGIAMDELVLRKSAERRLVYHWYQGTAGLGAETLRELLALDASPYARAWRGVVVRLSTPIDPAAARENATSTLRAMVELLRQPLAQMAGPEGIAKRGILVPLFSSEGKTFPTWQLGS